MTAHMAGMLMFFSKLTIIVVISGICVGRVPRERRPCAERFGGQPISTRVKITLGMIKIC